MKKNSIISEVFLAKRGKIYKRTAFSNQNENDADKVFQLIEGYRLKTRARFSVRPTTSKMKWFIDHLYEVFHLIRQIGIKNTLRFLRYAAQPKVLYVDCVKVINIKTKKTSLLKSNFGLPLTTQYTIKDLQDASCKEYIGTLENITNTFQINNLNQNAQTLSLGRQNKEKTIVFMRTNKSSNNTWIIAGAGNFCASMLIPAISNAGGKILGICSNMGASAEILANIYKIPNLYQTFEEMISAKQVASNLLIATPPFLHPYHLKLAIEAEYKIYSEKPVAVDEGGLEILEPYKNYENCMIGFNRRFAPAINFVTGSPEYKNYPGHKMITYIVHLGEFSIAMATKEIGGGTTVGSCCHYLDLIEYLAQSRISTFEVKAFKDSNYELVDGSTFACICTMKNGSISTLIFVRSSQQPTGIKEKVIISGDGLNIIINDFKEAHINNKKQTFWKNAKGWLNAMNHFQETTPLISSLKTPTLNDGLHICELAFRIDKIIATQIGEQ